MCDTIIMGALDGDGDQMVTLAEWSKMMPPELNDKILELVGEDGLIEELK